MNPSPPSLLTSDSTPAVSPNIDQIFNAAGVNKSSVFDKVAARHAIGVAYVASDQNVQNAATKIVTLWAGLSAGGVGGLKSAELVNTVQSALETNAKCAEGKNYDCILGFVNLTSSQLLETLSERFGIPSSASGAGIAVTEMVMAAATSYLYGFAFGYSE